MKHFFRLLTVYCLLTLLLIPKLYALDGADGSHDPGALIKEKGKYWMFTTGHGIYAAYSNDLFTWTAGAKTVFPVGTWPSWINQAVPGFEGIFWAPECFYMNGKYYMYYSCSLFGSPRSAIGVATSPTLDQDSPDYHWTDLGMVVSSSTRSDINAIDPAIFEDTDGRVYMSYGSFSGGIGIVELDKSTGKRKANAPIVRVAGGNAADWEAPFLFKEGNFYYLVVNRGRCCNGTSSTYKMVMGRSTNVTGPYIDKNGVDLRNNGGTELLASSGRYIGPGHFGLLRENGMNIVSMHYYDGNDNGHAKLDIANLGFSNGWPFLTRDWLAAGRYKLTNQNSKLVWDSQGCSGNAGSPVTQGQWNNQPCQQWDLTPVGNGYYEIKSVQSGLLAGLALDPYVDAGLEGSVSTGISPDTTVRLCNAGNGTKLQLDTRLGIDCQKFKIERVADGAFVLTSAAGDFVVEVPAASHSPGVQLGLWQHNGCTCQRWYINAPAAPLISKAVNPSPAHQAVNIDPGSVTLGWEGTMPQYNVYVGTSADKLQLKASGLHTNSFTLNNLVHQQTYYWRVDAVRNGELAVGDVWSFTVADTTAPTVQTKNITVYLSGGVASVRAQEIDNGSYDAYGIKSMLLSDSLFDCSSIGANQVTLTVTDNNGNAAKGTALVQVEGKLPSPVISVSRLDSTYTGGNEKTVYLGYGAQSLILNASDTSSANNAATYSWSPGTYLSSQVASNPTFSPKVPGTFTYLVTVTNEFGCTASKEIVLHVIDVRCGNNLDKVQLCHKGETLCLTASNVEGHLAHGCRLGACSGNTPTSTATSASSTTASDEKGEVAFTDMLDVKTMLKAFPNPASGSTIITTSLAQGGTYKLELYSMQGALVKVIDMGALQKGERKSLEIQTAGFATGIYLIKLMSEKEVLIERVIFQ